MIDLKNYLNESLLDDFDVLNTGIHDAHVEDMIKKADEMAGIKQPWKNNNDRNVNISKIENGVLKLAQIIDYLYNDQINDQFQKIKALEPYDTIIAYKNLDLRVREIDDSIAKEIDILNGGLVLGPTVQKIENVKIITGKDSDSRFGPALSSKGFDITFNNCHISNPNRSTLASRMRFGGIPTFNKCKIEGIKWVTIYSPSVLKDRHLKTFEKLVDPTHTAMYSTKPIVPKRLQSDNWSEVLKSKTNLVQKSGRFKQVYACLNNPKKYQFVPSEYGDTIFKVNPDFKLTDLFDVNCFDGLEKISISDNNIGITFYKAEDNKMAYTGFGGTVDSTNNLPLPNDKNWRVIISKKD